MKFILILLHLSYLCLWTQVLKAKTGIPLQNEDTREADEQAKKRAYHFGLGLAYISKIGNEYNHYEKLFGSPSIYPEFWGEYSPFNLGWGFDISFGMHVGYYRDTGHSAIRSTDLVLGGGGLNRDITEAEVDHSQKSVLTIVPLQGVISLGFSPFAARWVVANLWGGFGLTYIENTTKADLGDDADQADVKPYLNSGWNREQVIGASLSFDISALSPRDAYSLRVYGIESIYLTPYFQTVATRKNKVGIYDRSMMGLMFTFETRR